MHTGTDSSDTLDLLSQIVRGDATALDSLFIQHREYLRRIVDTRLYGPVRTRVDPSDIVQETLLAASRRVDDFLARRPTSFRIWLRQQAIERLIDVKRQHLRLKRDARRECTINDASSMAIAAGVLGDRASELLIRRELVDAVRRAMLSMAEQDRDIMLMRHGEQLTTAETAELLGVSVAAAGKRYGRALLRLGAELKRLGVTSN